MDEWQFPALELSLPSTCFKLFWDSLLTAAVLRMHLARNTIAQRLGIRGVVCLHRNAQHLPHDYCEPLLIANTDINNRAQKHSLEQHFAASAAAPASQPTITISEPSRMSSPEDGTGTRLKLMDLPPELRLQIYGEMLDRHHSSTEERSTNILAVSKQVNDETHDLLYAKNQLKIEFIYRIDQREALECLVKVCPLVKRVVQKGRVEERFPFACHGWRDGRVPKALTSNFQNVCIKSSTGLPDRADIGTTTGRIVEELKWQMYVVATAACFLGDTHIIEVQHPEWTLRATREAVASAVSDSQPNSAFEQLIEQLEVRLFGAVLPKPGIASWLSKKREMLQMCRVLGTSSIGRKQAIFLRRNFEAAESPLKRNGGYLDGGPANVSVALGRVESIFNRPQLQDILSQVRAGHGKS